MACTAETLAPGLPDGELGRRPTGIGNLHSGTMVQPKQDKVRLWRERWLGIGGFRAGLGAKVALGVFFATFFAFLAGVQKAGLQALEYLGWQLSCSS